MSAKDDEGSPGKPRGREARLKYRLPPGDLVRSVARRQLGRMGLAARSQAGLRRALLPSLAAQDPLFVLGGWRLRKFLLDSAGVRVDVRYAERPTRRPLQRCPVCWSAVRPIRNRTLEGDRVTLGYRCTHCTYWTHLRRRVPVRYRFVRVGIDGEPLDPMD
ncbi:MAG: hypothetical protein WA688_06815 [Thermoplasmata archaeon]